MGWQVGQRSVDCNGSGVGSAYGLFCKPLKEGRWWRLPGYKAGADGVGHVVLWPPAQEGPALQAWKRMGGWKSWICSKHSVMG